MWRSGVAMLLTLALAVAAWGIWRQLDHPVRSVRVQGVMSDSERQSIRDVVLKNLTGGILSLSTADLVRDIEALSWPRAVRVRRVWPDALSIDVERESVVAVWGDGGYLTSAGKVVSLADGPEGVPYLAASLSSPRQAMDLYQLLTLRVAPAGLTIVRLEENPLGEWLLTFGSGMTLALGNEALTERVSRFLIAYQRVLSGRAEQVSHVDTRYDSGLAVRWSEAQLASVERSTR